MHSMGKGRGFQNYGRLSDYGRLSGYGSEIFQNYGRLSGDCFHTRYNCMNAREAICLEEALVKRLHLCKHCTTAWLKGDMSTIKTSKR